MGEEQAKKLTQFLIQPSPAYDHKSPLIKRVEVGIEQIAREIAAEIIAENPEIKTIIRRQTEQLIAKALRDDAYLSEVIIKSVAQGLHKYIGSNDE